MTTSGQSLNKKIAILINMFGDPDYCTLPYALYPRWFREISFTLEECKNIRELVLNEDSTR